MMASLAAAAAASAPLFHAASLYCVVSQPYADAAAGIWQNTGGRAGSQGSVFRRFCHAMYCTSSSSSSSSGRAE
jgi:hypothetical protein